MIDLLLVILVSFVVTCLILGIDTIYRVRTDPKARAEYEALKEKAKQEAKEREEEKAEKKRRKKEQEKMPYRSTVPCMDHNITY